MARLTAGTRRRVDGRFERRFTYQGKRYCVYGATDEIVVAKEKEKRAELEAGIYHTNDRLTFGQYFKEWISRKETTDKPATINAYMMVYKRHIEPELGRRPIKKIERRQLITMLGKIYRNRSAYMANWTKGIIFSVLKAAAADEVIVRNVAENIPRFKEQSTKPARETIHRELTEEETESFFRYSRGSLYDPIFRFMLATGARAGEAAGLQWCDIDRKRNIIHIRRTMTMTAEGRLITGTSTKTPKGRRDIPMNKTIQAIIEKQWDLYTARSNVVDLTAPVFPGEHGNHMRPSSLNFGIKRVLAKMKKAGEEIAPFTSHAFRDTFASRAARSGMAPNVLKELLGHSSYKMTMDIYVHINEADKAAAMARMAASV